MRRIKKAVLTLQAVLLMAYLNIKYPLAAQPIIVEFESEDPDKAERRGPPQTEA